jgi:predicted ATPase
MSDVLAAYGCHPIVFLAPPWEAIFAGDHGRRHGFAEAVDEYRRIAAALPTLGYEAVALPFVDPAERADFMLAALAA